MATTGPISRLTSTVTRPATHLLVTVAAMPPEQLESVLTDLRDQASGSWPLARYPRVFWYLKHLLQLKLHAFYVRNRAGRPRQWNGNSG